MSEALRTLPIRLAPLDGEALDSWLEALARRLDTPLGEVMRNVGLPSRHRAESRVLDSPADWTILLGPQQAAAVSSTTGLDQARIHKMTLRHFDNRALKIDAGRRRVHLGLLWGRGSGSRFCPDCLAENTGRWMLSWRLGWSFACVRHLRMLADCCPNCGRVPRSSPRSPQSVPEPGRCGDARAGSGRTFIRGCGFDLSQADTLRLNSAHPGVTAQALLLKTIESGSAAFGPYALAPQPTLTALADIRAICGRVLSTLPAEELARWASSDLTALHLRPDPGSVRSRIVAARGEQRPGFMAPSRAVTAATAVTAALHVLNQTDAHEAGAVLRPLLMSIRDGNVQVSPSTISDWGRGISPVLTAIHLAAVAPSCRPGDHLRHRMPTLVPRFPASTSADITRRSRKVAGMFWSSWAVRLAPPDGTFARVMAPALAASLLLVDSRIDFATAARRAGNVIDDVDLSRILQRLDDDPCWSGIVSALVRLADHLDTNDVPIDYSRRRRLDYTHLLPAERWAAICRLTDTPPGTGRREQLMRCHLFHRISGQPLEAAPGHPGINDAVFRADYFRLITLRSPELAQALDKEAGVFLERHRVHDEPITWQPPTSLLDGLLLPGMDPDHVDIHRLHQLIRQPEHPTQRVAEILDTSIEAIRHLLDEHPAPLPPPTEAQAKAAGEAFKRAMETLPKTELARLYLDEHRSLQQIAERCGFSRQVLTRLARSYDIPLRNGPQDYRRRETVDADWLFEQYVHRRRTLPDLAREKGMSVANMNRWAHQHGIPLRPRGGASHDGALHAADRETCSPEILRKALTDLHARQRLDRFLSCLAYTTLTDAACGLGISQSTLTIQIKRLEQDFGQPLLERAERGRAMHPTEFGQRVAEAITINYSAQEFQTAS